MLVILLTDRLTSAVPVTVENDSVTATTELPTEDVTFTTDLIGDNEPTEAPIKLKDNQLMKRQFVYPVPYPVPVPVYPSIKGELIRSKIRIFEALILKKLYTPLILFGK